MLIVVAYSWLQSRRAEVRTVRAVVARKRFIHPNDYYMTFGMPGGEREFVVREGVYFSADEGQWGSLTFQGETFRGFIPDPQVVDHAPAGPPKRPPRPLNPDYEKPNTP